MSRIPDCRNDEFYNEKYLKGADKDFVNGYDWCQEAVVDNFFNNLDVYFGDDSHMMHMLNEPLPESLKDEYTEEFKFGGRESEDRKIETYADLLRYNLLDWIEMQRDELITSMIDNMNDGEYDKVKADVDGQSEENNR